MKVENDILIPEIARLLKEGKEVRLTPSGVSMRPFIEGDRDSVILAPLAPMSRCGQIVLARVRTEDGTMRYVLHRIIRITTQSSSFKGGERERLYTLMGDGNLSGEEQCTQDDLIAVVKRIETPSGRRKPLTRARLWYHLLPLRKYLLKIYRHTWLKRYALFINI